MEKVIIKKNSDINSYDLDEIDVKEVYRSVRKSGNHLCPSCDNCRPVKCLKIFDEVKRPLGDYEFVKEGLQIYKDDEMQCFYITKCDNYVKDRERSKPSTLEEIENLKRVHESIKIAYFDAETIEEANQTQFDLFKRGQLTSYQVSVKKR